MDNELLEVSEDNIYLEFILDNQQYAVISNKPELNENDEVYFAKIEIKEGIKILKNIENEEEYSKVLLKYEKILDSYEGCEGIDV